MINKNLINAVACIIFLTTTSYSPANNHFSSYQQADQIEIDFLMRDQSFVYLTSDKNHLHFFKDLLENKNKIDRFPYDSTGEIIYLRKHKPLFKVYFSTKATGSKFKTSAIAYSKKNKIVQAPFTYNAGMIVDEVFYKLTKP